MSGFLAFGVTDGLEDSFSPIDRYPEHPSRRGQFICRHTCTACDSPNALVRSQYERVLFLHNASLKRQAKGNDGLQQCHLSPASPPSEPSPPEAPTASETSPATTKATPIAAPPLVPGGSSIRLISLRRCSSLQLLLQPFPRLPHLRIPQMHFPIKVIRQPPIIVEST